MYYVYILKGKKYYCWSTNNIKRRLQEHKRGTTKTSKQLQAHTLIGYYKIDKEEDARILERKIKDSGHIERRTQKKRFYTHIVCMGRWCSGNMTVFGTAVGGSIPSRPELKNTKSL